MPNDSGWRPSESGNLSEDGHAALEADAISRLERGLAAALAAAEAPDAPPRLAAALRHAVLPHGALVRPRLCLAVAAACHEDNPALTDAAAVAIELLHCASLVHDDLPCFDDAAVRRGRPTVHGEFGEAIAVLAGDALIVLAFQTLLRVPAPAERLSAILGAVAGAVGMPGGIVAGQAWERESVVDLGRYHRAKTASLFAAATVAGSAAAGKDGERWRSVGERLGEGYQVADDIRDMFGDAGEIGKPTGRDAALDRPNAARELGLDKALRRLRDLMGQAVAEIPGCPGEDRLKTLIFAESRRLLPEGLARFAA